MALFRATYFSVKLLQVSQFLIGWTNCPRHVWVGVAVLAVLVVAVLVGVGTVCGPMYKVDDDVV